MEIKAKQLKAKTHGFAKKIKGAAGRFVTVTV